MALASCIGENGENWPGCIVSPTLDGMHVDERIIRETTSSLAPAAGAWFLARQPGVVRFLESRLQGDALVVALHGARLIAATFRKKDGAPPPRLIRAVLERGESTVISEGASRRGVHNGCAARQPALVAWLVELIHDPPVPLDDDEKTGVARCLAAVIYGFDQLTTGRWIP